MGGKDMARTRRWVGPAPRASVLGLKPPCPNRIQTDGLKQVSNGSTVSPNWSYLGSNSTLVHATPPISTEGLLGVTTLKLPAPELHPGSPDFTYLHLTSPNI